MNKLISGVVFLGLWIAPFVAPQAAIAEEHLLSCKANGDREVHLFKLKSGQFEAREKDNVKIEVHTLDVLGNTNLKYTQGPFGNLKSTLVFVSKERIGTTLLVARNLQNKIVAEITRGRSGLDLECLPGAQYGTLEKLLKAEVTIEKTEYEDYTDSELAFRCTSPVGPFTVRALSFSLGESEIQLRYQASKGLNRDFQAKGLDTLGKQIIYYGTGYESSSLFLIENKPFKKDGKIFYRVQVNHDKKLFPALCEEKWSVQRNILKALQDLEKLPRNFPIPAGTKAQLDPRTCDSKYSQLIVERYSKLFQKIGSMTSLGLYSKGLGNPMGDDCVSLYLTYRADAEAMKKIKSTIGESLEGLFVVYGE